MPMQYTIYWYDGTKNVVGPLEMGDFLINQKEQIALWREGDDRNYIWNSETQSWEKKTFFGNELDS